MTVAKESVISTKSSGDDGGVRILFTLIDGSFHGSSYNFNGDKLAQVECLGYLCVLGNLDIVSKRINAAVATKTLLVGILVWVFDPAALTLLFVMV